MAAFQLKPRGDNSLRLLSQLVMQAQFPQGDAFIERRAQADDELRIALWTELCRHTGRHGQIRITRLSYGGRRSACLPRLLMGGDDHFINVVYEQADHVHHAFIYL